MQRESEGNLPKLTDKEGIIVEMRDADSMSSWSFKYKLSLISYFHKIYDMRSIISKIRISY